jgi:hypothetical protein
MVCIHIFALLDCPVPLTSVYQTISIVVLVSGSNLIFYNFG